MGRFINADEYASTGQGILGNNMYAYCLNNPVIYKDSTGNVAETVFDVISLGFSIADVIANPKDPWAWAGLVGDIVDVAVPFVAGVGEVIKAAKIADTAIDTVDTVHDATRAADKIDDGIKYTDKVIAQMENTNDLNHSFPLVIDTMMDAGTSKPLIGGDGMIREIIEIPGAINGKQGVYEYIIGPDRWCNHRFFREWR